MPNPLTGNDDQANEPGASPAPDAASSTAPNEAEGADPPDPEGDAKDDGLSAHDVLEKVLNASNEEDAGEEAENATEGDKSEGDQPKGAKAEDGKKDDGDKAGEMTEISDEEMKSFKPQTQKRVQELLDQRKEQHEARVAAEAEVERLKPLAENYEAIERFRTESELSSDEMAAGFEIMRLIKQDPLKARDALRPYMDALNEATGEVLSPELQRDVDAGVISEEKARELSRAQKAASLQEQAAAKARERLTARERQTSQQSQERQQRDAIQSWDKMQIESDPDYQHIRPLMQSEFQMLYAQKQPKDVQALTALLNEAKGNVVQRLKAAGFTRTAQKPPVDPVRPTETPGAPAAPKEPKNTLDIIDNVLAASGTTR